MLYFDVPFLVTSLFVRLVHSSEVGQLKERVGCTDGANSSAVRKSVEKTLIRSGCRREQIAGCPRSDRSVVNQEIVLLRSIRSHAAGDLAGEGITKDSETASEHGIAGFRGCPGEPKPRLPNDIGRLR